jgi:hypothetical protein
MIDARLPDYKAAIQEALSESGAPFAVYVVDDFYLINPKHHAEVIDYLHRLLRDTDLYLKILLRSSSSLCYLTRHSGAPS